MADAMIPAAAILAGGAGGRPGRDPGPPAGLGETVLERTARLAREAGCRTAVVGCERPAGWRDAQVAFLPDAVAGVGPLGGLLAALRWAGGPVLALPCDLPVLDREAVEWLLAAWRERPAEVAHRWPSTGLAALRGGDPEPLFAVYAGDAVPAIEQALARGERSCHGIIRATRMRLRGVPPLHARAVLTGDASEAARDRRG
jgi:molybdopterin-guanine dinucleotide biosynthesis protein A